MAIYLFEPFEDEPLDALVGRYVTLMKIRSLRHLPEVKSAMGDRSQGRASSLEWWEEQTIESLGWDWTQIARNLTIYPFVSAFVAPSKRQALLEASRRYKRNYKLKMPAELRYCRDCFADDCRQGRVEHWRRSHQLPGALFCYLHGEALYISKNISSLADKFDTQLAKKCGVQIRLNLTSAQRERCIAVALCAHNTLYDERLYFPPPRGQSFHSTATAVGYGRWGGCADSTNLLVEYREFYGDEFIDTCALMYGGADVSRLSLPGFRVQFMRREWEVLLLSEFMQHAWNPLWPYCANPLADHGPDFRVSFICRRGSQWLASCECGFSFRFIRTYINGRVMADVTSYGSYSLRDPIHSEAETWV